MLANIRFRQTALTVSTITPFLFTGLMLAWTIGYSTLQKKKYERAPDAAGQAAQPTQPSVSGPPERRH